MNFENIKQTARQAIEQVNFNDGEAARQSMIKIIAELTEAVLHTRSVDHDAADPTVVKFIYNNAHQIIRAQEQRTAMRMNAGVNAQRLTDILFQAAHGLADTLEPTQHPDDVAVDLFATAMKAKLKKSREVKGRSGWEDPNTVSAVSLSNELVRHCDKGDPVDVANFCMMLHQRGERIIK